MIPLFQHNYLIECEVLIVHVESQVQKMDILSLVSFYIGLFKVY